MNRETNGQQLSRRSFVTFALSATTAAMANRTGNAAAAKLPGIWFKARGANGFLGAGDRLAYINADGTSFRVFDFARPNQIGWGVYDFFPDGRAVLFSIETDEDWKTKPFDVYYKKSRTHIWAFDGHAENLHTGKDPLTPGGIPSRTDPSQRKPPSPQPSPTRGEGGKLTEIVTKDRLAPFYAPCSLIANGERILVSALMDGRSILFDTRIDGSDAKRLTEPSENVYGVSVSPDGKRVAFHADYNIYTAKIDGSDRKKVAGTPGGLFFGTSWSPDSQWVLYQVCDSANDPGHDWSDLWIGRSDGSKNRQLTFGNSAWFASSYGAKDNPGGGSIMPKWAPDGSAILYARRLPDSKVPWEFQASRPDTTHFNRDFKPASARGGAQITAVDPKTSRSTPLAGDRAIAWEFRPEWSADSQSVLFLRAGVGENPALWIMDRDGTNARILTNGIGHGAEFPRWAP